MPISVAELFNHANLNIDGVVRWGTKPNEQRSGVYVVAISGDANKLVCLDTIPVSHSSISDWILRNPVMRIDHHIPTVESMSERLSQFWLPNETILYIGQTNRPLRSRVAEMYNHVLGAKWHHSAGQWLKTLNNLEGLSVFYSVVENNLEQIENSLFRSFHNSASTNKEIGQHEVVMPFANRQAPAIDGSKRFFRKEHKISAQVI